MRPCAASPKPIVKAARGLGLELAAASIECLEERAAEGDSVTKDFVSLAFWGVRPDDPADALRTARSLSTSSPMSFHSGDTDVAHHAGWIATTCRVLDRIRDDAADWKDTGNQKFTSKDFFGAFECYAAALRCIQEGNVIMSRPTLIHQAVGGAADAMDRHRRDVAPITVTLLVNASTALWCAHSDAPSLHVHHLERIQRFCDRALSIAAACPASEGLSRMTVKAHYRCGMARLTLGDLPNAETNLRVAMRGVSCGTSGDWRDRAQLTADIDAALARLQAARSAERVTARRMLLGGS